MVKLGMTTSREFCQVESFSSMAVCEQANCCPSTDLCTRSFSSAISRSLFSRSFISFLTSFFVSFLPSAPNSGISEGISISDTDDGATPPSSTHSPSPIEKILLFSSTFTLFADGCLDGFPPSAASVEAPSCVSASFFAAVSCAIRASSRAFSSSSFCFFSSWRSRAASIFFWSLDIFGAFLVFALFGSSPGTPASSVCSAVGGGDGGRGAAGAITDAGGQEAPVIISLRSSSCSSSCFL
mmetsp:Transcript_32925/g.44584  ORF Transcript_32925/g.44584 Transcript_32925/m.44584 type:complete len:240 (-) Transcript_32925:83-802(-)